MSRLGYVLWARTVLHLKGKHYPTPCFVLAAKSGWVKLGWVSVEFRDNRSEKQRERVSNSRAGRDGCNRLPSLFSSFASTLSPGISGRTHHLGTSTEVVMGAPTTGAKRLVFQDPAPYDSFQETLPSPSLQVWLTAFSAIPRTHACLYLFDNTLC